MEGEKGDFYKQMHSLSSYYDTFESERVKRAIKDAAKQGRFYIHWKADNVKLEAATKEFLLKEGFKVVQKTKWTILIQWKLEEKKE
jgi:hypothetical protein